MELFCFPKKFTIVHPFSNFSSLLFCRGFREGFLLFGQNGAIFGIYGHPKNFQDKGNRRPAHRAAVVY